MNTDLTKEELDKLETKCLLDWKVNDALTLLGMARRTLESETKVKDIIAKVDQMTIADWDIPAVQGFLTKWHKIKRDLEAKDGEAL